MQATETDNVKLSGLGRWNQEGEDSLLQRFEQKQAESSGGLDPQDRQAIDEILGVE